MLSERPNKEPTMEEDSSISGKKQVLGQSNHRLEQITLLIEEQLSELKHSVQTTEKMSELRDRRRQQKLYSSSSEQSDEDQIDEEYEEMYKKAEKSSQPIKAVEKEHVTVNLFVNSSELFNEKSLENVHAPKIEDVKKKVLISDEELLKLSAKHQLEQARKSAARPRVQPRSITKPPAFQYVLRTPDQTPISDVTISPVVLDDIHEQIPGAKYQQIPEAKYQQIPEAKYQQIPAPEENQTVRIKKIDVKESYQKSRTTSTSPLQERTIHPRVIPKHGVNQDTQTSQTQDVELQTEEDKLLKEYVDHMKTTTSETQTLLSSFMNEIGVQTEAEVDTSAKDMSHRGVDPVEELKYNPNVEMLDAVSNTDWASYLCSVASETDCVEVAHKNLMTETDVKAIGVQVDGPMIVAIGIQTDAVLPEETTENKISTVTQNAETQTNDVKLTPQECEEVDLMPHSDGENESITEEGMFSTEKTNIVLAKRQKEPIMFLHQQSVSGDIAGNTPSRGKSTGKIDPLVLPDIAIEGHKLNPESQRSEEPPQPTILDTTKELDDQNIKHVLDDMTLAGQKFVMYLKTDENVIVGPLMFESEETIHGLPDDSNREGVCRNHSRECLFNLIY